MPQSLSFTVSTIRQRPLNEALERFFRLRKDGFLRLIQSANLCQINEQRTSILAVPDGPILKLILKKQHPTAEDIEVVESLSEFLSEFGFTAKLVLSSEAPERDT